ncbi:hypothetical protein COW36_11010 [bacterium (Candidatus Blackallbacteria) CG17_big_fil_post_rev_8_21_14_2_50_48_46]|uniref:Peptidase S8/S53 domain-containing protein n=1 Tax=bacterium (Candidatus Blackallbacteria) CG17_big_fil_post_rev_8_21_14_2_50_48_46 TaxID=2014261 RepID=A0A2M7G5F1_9BACT|nr:MAG: hypothetical protein COW64_18105 [bacterium (Candidatus Blackallbacteria) CG18_big_fil_WC_8_21_14_2_50_49_26]PIW16804.1 MAG: hypothetical protein COW36_11010 [bacterium (Candidatus Blackallbacteria) CG17_big_fil_post_rev_8_21_14_2_50_48_46]PIW48001.1 MAG: hypothetical protein COW20_10725 [bacterium (Candidatus Blackallbacteria) CG13_big_fil_rev_8_21_14_2_50_49_14]
MKRRLLTFAALLSLFSCQNLSLNGSSLEQEKRIYPSLKAQQLMIAAPDARSLEILTRRLKAKVLDRLQIGTKEWVLLGFSQASLPGSLADDLAESWNHSDLRALKQILPEAQWKTWVLAEDIRRNTGYAPAQIQVNQEAELPGSLAFNDLSSGLGSADEGWWRRETGVERAWLYSIGTGVSVAWIDLGFKRNHPEIERRMRVGRYNNQTLAWRAVEPANIEKPNGDHGLASLLVGFAERDNGIPTVGVAPNAEVMPFVAGSVWEVAKALLAAAAEKPDLIGMNYAFPMYPGWENLKEYEEYLPLKEAIAEVLKHSPNLPLIVPAHNYGEPIQGGPREWFPISLSKQPEFQQLMGVGGVEFKEGKTPAVWFNPNILTGYNSRGSNYGEGLIWAPSTALDIANSDPLAVIPNQMYGTSASAPFMAGVLALLKSRCPLQTPVQLKDLLLKTGKPLDAALMLSRAGATVPFVQVDLALQACLQAEGKNLSQSQAQTFSGKLSQNSQGEKILVTPLETLKLMPTLSNLQAGWPHPLLNQQVRVRGWKKRPDSEIEALEVLDLALE